MEIGKPLRRHQVVPITEPVPATPEPERRAPQRTPSSPTTVPASPQPSKVPERV